MSELIEKLIVSAWIVVTMSFWLIGLFQPLPALLIATVLTAAGICAGLIRLVWTAA